MRCKTGEETWAHICQCHPSAWRGPARRGLGADRPEGFRGRGAPPSGAGDGRGTRHRLARFPLGCRRPRGRGRSLRERLAKRFARNRAVQLLSHLDDRLLADIGLRRADIQLAVDGRLADPRVRRQAAMAGLLLEGRRRPLPDAPANSNQPVPHDPFPTWPPDSHRRTGWILSVRSAFGSWRR